MVDGALARSQARFRPAQEVTPDHRFKCQGEFTADKLVWRGRAKGLPMLKVPAEIPLDDAPVTDLQQSEVVLSCTSWNEFSVLDAIIVVISFVFYLFYKFKTRDVKPKFI